MQSPKADATVIGHTWYFISAIGLTPSARKVHLISRALGLKISEDRIRAICAAFRAEDAAPIEDPLTVCNAGTIHKGRA